MAGYIKLLGTPFNGPVRQTSSIVGVTATLGLANTASTLGGTQYARNAPQIAYFGGDVGNLGTTWPKNQFTSTYNLTDGNGSRYGVGGKIAFTTDSRKIDLQILSIGGNAECAIAINGQTVALPAIQVPNDGAARYLQIDLTGVAGLSNYNTIEIEFQGGANLQNLVVEPGASIYEVAESGPRIVMLGDSFTGGFGSRTKAEDFVSLTGLGLGTLDTWQSGVGGTGWVKTLGTNVSLHDRIIPDGVGADGDLYIIAMGLNDGTGIQTAVEETLATLRAGVPSSRIILVGPWNPASPGGAVKPAVDAEIKAAVAMFPGISYIDASRLSFTTIDGVHPDAAGHWTVAEWLIASVQRVLGSDGLIDAGIAGDVVGPLFLSSFVDGETYSYDVTESTGLPSRFEIVQGNDQFPVLKLKEGQAVTSAGGVHLNVRATDSHGQVVENQIFVRVRPNQVGTDGVDVIAGGAEGVRLEGLGGDDLLIGGIGDDSLFGGTGNDRLDGGAGVDTMEGQQGDDSYYVERAGDFVIEQANEGYDTVYSALSAYGLTENVEALRLLDGAIKGGGNDLDNLLVGNGLDNTLYGLEGNDKMFGLGGNDILFGDAGNDWLIGGSGRDNMGGGLGDDRYAIEDIGDAIQEFGAQGYDRADQFIIDYTLPANVEHLEMVGSAARTGTGNSLANLIVGNAADNILRGLDGPDTLIGLDGADRLEGGTGNDRLIGGAGIDTLLGGAGDDNYEVGDSDDVIIELQNEGWDTVIQYATSYTLSANVEAIDMRAGATYATGNAMSNTIHGNAGDNTIMGLDGADRLYGNAGSDVIEGGSGNDYLNGGEGADLLIGGPGDDVYEIGDFGDTIIELPGEGRDRVIQTVADYRMADGIEVLDMRNGAISGTGNALDNNMFGNAANNILDGGEGSDRLYGWGGDDTFVESTGLDFYYGGEGADKVVFSGNFEEYTFKFASDRLYVFNSLTGEESQIFEIEGLVFDNHTATIDYGFNVIG